MKKIYLSAIVVFGLCSISNAQYNEMQNVKNYYPMQKMIFSSDDIDNSEFKTKKVKDLSKAVFDTIWKETFDNEADLSATDVNAFWQKDTSTALSVNTSAGYAQWEWSDEAAIKGGISTLNGTPRITGTTGGYVYFYPGKFNNTSGTRTDEKFDKSITSGVIDTFLTMPSKVSVLVRIRHKFRYCCDPTKIKLNFCLSKNNGKTWDTVNFISKENIDHNEGFSSVSEIVLGDINPNDSVRLKFQWIGQYYYWIIEDIVMLENRKVNAHLDEVFAYGYPPRLVDFKTLVSNKFYTKMPLKYSKIDTFALYFTGRNNGYDTAKSSNFVYNVKDPDGATHSYVSDNMQDVKPYASYRDSIRTQNIVPFTKKGEYSIVAKAQSTNEITENTDSIKYNVTIGDTVFAWDNGKPITFNSWTLTTSTGTLDDGGVILAYDIPGTSIAKSVSVYIDRRTKKDAKAFPVIFKYTPPGTYETVADGPVVDIKSGVSGFVTFKLNPTVLEQGTYYVGLRIEAGSGDIEIGGEKFVPLGQGAIYRSIKNAWGFVLGGTPLFSIRLNIFEEDCVAKIKYVDGDIQASGIGGDGKFTFSWAGPNGKTATTSAVTKAALGVWTVTATDGKGCVATASYNVIINAIDENTLENNVLVYPNPVVDLLNIKFSNVTIGKYTFELKNILGQTIITEIKNVKSNQSLSINVSGLDRGIYFLTIRNNKNEKSLSKIILD